MLALPRELDAGDGSQQVPQSQLVDVGLPVVDAVVLRGRYELQLFGGEVDDPVVGIAVVVAAG